MTERLYCYVDETGQDTQGDLFVASVVITGQDRNQMLELCEKIEQKTGKGRMKWIKTDYARRLAYIHRILQEPAFKGKLNFAVYCNSRDYLPLTVLTIARAIVACEERTYKATVLIDGLSRSQERWIGSELRHLHIQIRKVRGVRKDENDALIRLADALCGFVRAAWEGQSAMKELVKHRKQSGFLREL